MKNDTIEVGDRVKDRVSGFCGLVVGITEWLTGCRHIGVRPEKLDKTSGKPSEIGWLDEPQCVIVKKSAIVIPRTSDDDRSGGPSLHGYPR